MASGQADLLILDEINNALHLKLVDLEQVLDLLRNKPPRLHLVLTGRDAHPQVIELADALRQMTREEQDRLLVMEQDRLVGLITKSSLLRFVQVKRILDPEELAAA